MTQNNHETVDVLLVGAGIMSATLAVLLKELDPGLTLEIAELRESGAIESSNPWNNAGTGHAGLCELNYTPQAADGTVDIKKAVTINTQFEVSKQFWSYLCGKSAFGSPKSFINSVPHLSFVRGEKDVAFLKTRHAALTQHHAFADMAYTEDQATMAEWMPLMMQGRDANERIAATRALNGTDVNFGALTNQLLQYLASQGGINVSYNQKVTGLTRTEARTPRAARCAMSRLASCSSAQVVVHCRCCRCPVSRKARGLAVSRSVASGCAATTPRWSSATRPRFTARPK